MELFNGVQHPGKDWHDIPCVDSKRHFVQCNGTASALNKHQFHLIVPVHRAGIQGNRNLKMIDNIREFQRSMLSVFIERGNVRI